MPAIFVLLLQVLFTLGAGWLLWKIWLRLSAIDPRAGTLIGAGLIIRALLAQAMFWISYLHLPIARSLQTGDGFWALAIDGRLYFENAAALLSQGWSAVALVNKTLPSPAYLQVLAVFQSLFGPVASVGALLNLFAYLGACAAILRLGGTAAGSVARPALIAIAAFSFAPAVIIWSVQPLKDPFFIFTIAAFVVACTMWQEAWRERFSAGRFFLPLLLMLTLLYLVVGTRWYFGVLFWGASVPYFAAAAWRSNRRVLAAVTNAAVFVALSQIIVFGALPYVPPQLLVHFGHDAQTPHRTIAETVVQSRQNFDTVHANTMIESGTALRKVDTPPIVEPPRQIASRPPARKENTLPENTASLPVKADTPAVLPRATDSAPPPMSSVAQAPEASQPAQGPQGEPSNAPAIESTPNSASTEAVRQQVDREPTPAAVTETFTPAPSRKTTSQVSSSHKSLTREVKAVHETPPSTVMEIAPKGVAPRSAAPAPPGAVAVAPKPLFKPVAQVRVMPQSTFARLTAGLTAVVLPHFLGERMGLIHIGGGRGLWAIVETDTLFFDGLLLIVLYYVYRALPRGAWRNPTFWLVVISTAGVTVLLAYTISNFGTLFRHRGMIFICLCLLLVVARDTRPSAGPLQEDLIAES